MRIQVITPAAILVDETATKVNAEAANGSFTLLPRHIDFVAVLVAGILTFTNEEGQEQFIAIDEGVLVKRSEDVCIATSRAVHGPSLEELQRVVDAEFRQLNEQEQMARTAVSRLEAGFIRRLLEEQRHQ